MSPLRTIRLIGLAILAAAAMLAAGRIQASAQVDDPAKLQEGAKLYAENCAMCHGPNGEGRVGATLAKNWPSIRPDLDVRNIIENGVPGSPMPAWSQAKGGPLSAEQIDALAYFILSWSAGGPDITPPPTVTPYPPITPVANVEGDPNHGATLFAENCVACHGQQGEGRVGATLAKDWPGIRPDLNIKDTISNGVSGSPMPAWLQAKGGPLSEADINDLTAFVLAMPKSVVQVQPTPAAPARPLSWLSGPGGVIVFVLLFVLIIAGALLIQRRP